MFNVVTTSRANTAAVGKLMCTSPKVAGLSFTGRVVKEKLICLGLQCVVEMYLFNVGFV